VTDNEIALNLCNEYNPRKPGMAAAIARALQTSREYGRQSAMRNIDGNMETILAVTKDGREFVCAMEVDRLLEEAEDRVLADVCMRTGLCISVGDPDGVMCDSGDGEQRPVPNYKIDYQA
jgi:hypothetical protein